MPYTIDPRLRQSLDNLNARVEALGDRIQQSLYQVHQGCLQPCLRALQPCCAGLQSCVEASCQPCFSARDENRRQVSNWRGRDAAAFEFYDEWDDDADGWGNDELDALLGPPSPHDGTQQPARSRGMRYETIAEPSARRDRGPSLSSGGQDEAVVPQSSMFGFLQSWPWKIGGKGVRYAPRPANLQSNVRRDQYAALGTPKSGEIASSLSSRDDLFPSDDEGDAMEIDDDYAVKMLARRGTGMSDDRSSNRTRSSRQPPDSRGRDRSSTNSSGPLQTPKSAHS